MPQSSQAKEASSFSTDAEGLQSSGRGVDEIPDGGMSAWLVVIGSTLALFSSFGIVNSYGVFQDYYTTHSLAGSASSSISIIGAFQLFLLYGLGPIVGRIFDAFGARVLLPVGTVILVLSIMLIPFCKELYQFFLVQGLMFGIGNSLIFTPSLAVLGQWFRRRRALVIGIAGAGSSAGGVIYPIMIQKLILRVGFPWAVRIAGFTALVCLSGACLAMKTRLPLKKKIAFRGIIDLHGFRDTQYVLAAVGSFLYFYGLFIPYFYIQLYASLHGVDPQLSAYLLAIINALGVPARIIPGILADRFGALQILLPCTFLSAIFVFVLWLPFPSSGPIVAFCALYGLFSGAFVTLIPAYIASRSPVEKFGARLGSIYIFVAIATLIGTPTAGAFVPALTQHNFTRLIVFTGVLEVAGGTALGVAHFVTLRERRPAEEESSSEEMKRDKGTCFTDEDPSDHRT
ncbi:hypothetical protein M0805_007417 [Coniferiporia weirii]|nr:hypothetical protein M0805_007417 [Coniferiporia weirii]